MTTVTETIVHRHTGGSVGGPGENDADCACGIAFSGFDTQAEAMKALNAHIADETRDPWAVLAARIVDQPLPDYRLELDRIAADVAALTGSGLARPRYFSLKTELVIDIQPGDGRDDEATALGVDAVAQMLFGRDGVASRMTSGTWHYGAQGTRGPIEVRVYNEVSAEWAARWGERQKAAAERDELLAKLATAEADAKRLRAELAERDGRSKHTPTCVALIATGKGDGSKKVCGHEIRQTSGGLWVHADWSNSATSDHSALFETEPLDEYAPEGRTTAVAAAKPDTYGEPLGHHGNGEVHLPEAGA